MRKNIAALLLAAALLCLPLGARGETARPAQQANAETAPEIDLGPDAEPVPAPAEPAPLSAGPLLESPPFQSACASLMLLEADSGQIIFEMNADAPRPVASVTKVMTILLALEAIDQGRLNPEDEIAVSDSAAGMGGSQVLLDVGERQSVSTLLKCMIVGSANDAAVALAEAMYGGEAACVEAMNRRAAELGMADTHFENCTGLPAQDQHTTARDVAVMSRQMFAHPLYFDYSSIWMENIDHGDGRITELVNTNKLIRLYDGCDGGKTGSTGEAGYCVSATARRGGMRLIAVVLGAAEGKERFAIARRMFDYGYANYRLYPVARRGTRVKGRLPVSGGARDGVTLMLDGDLTLLVSKGGEQDVSLRPNLPESIAAPVAAGQVVGSVTVTLGGRVVAEIPVAAVDDVAAKGLRRDLRRIWQSWLLR